MTQEKMEELAKAAAHSAALARHAETRSDEKTVVDTFLTAYEYALKKIYEKQQQTQREVTQEFGSYSAKFR